MATPGGGNPQPDHCPHCGAVKIAEVGMTFAAGEMRWLYECAACNQRFVWPTP
jgi:transcription elongation factor Elf1